MRLKLSLIGLVCYLALISCQNSNGNGDKIVATIYDKTLYQSDLQSIMYEGISYNDSIVRTKAFIDNWIRRQLVIHQAENNFDASELDFSKELEDYRNSLIIYICYQRYFFYLLEFRYLYYVLIHIFGS